ncbi:gliding motility-associated protein glde [Flammeovirgaceae bacterium 311]|nr:gliding motility-associated protein glde [Flammeovirgaceae bacterium 311]
MNNTLDDPYRPEPGEPPSGKHVNNIADNGSAGFGQMGAYAALPLLLPNVLMQVPLQVAVSPSDWLFYTISGLALVFLLLMSALISGSEVAYFSFDGADVAECQRSPAAADKKVLKLLEKPRSLLATILILNNFTNIAIVTLSTFVTWRIVGGRTTEGLVVTLLTFLVTVLIVFFGEVVPKVYATSNNLSFARRMSGFLSGAETFFRPLSWFLIRFSNIIEKRIVRKNFQITVDHLNLALDITTSQGTTEEEKGILKGIVNFGTLTVKQVMRSRLDITAFDYEYDFHELMDKVNKSGYSRVPVYEETVDTLKGVLYVKDLLPYLHENEYFKWQDLLRPVFYIPETKKIDSLLKDFQEKRIHLAIVVDEYGGTSGLITLEDIIEEIVGEINDEFDEEDIAYNKLDETTYVFEGKTSLNDFAKIISVDPAIFEVMKGESESLGGLLLEINNKLPRAGEKIYFERFVFTVVSVDMKRIKRVRVLIKPVVNEVKPVRGVRASS